MTNKIQEYLNKYIIGQQNLKLELSRFISAMQEGEKFNLLFLGPSGYGKTHTIKVVYNLLGVKHTIEYEPNNININLSFTNHVIDEVHCVTEFEKLYKFMDLKQVNFLFGTNLPELLSIPLYNRCVTFHLDSYTEQELGFIIKKHVDLNLPDTYYDFLGSISRGNPRTAKLVGTRFRLLVKEIGVPRTNEELVSAIEKLYIKDGGFTTHDLIYLEFLKKIKVASLKTISNVTKLNIVEITNEIEPFLLNRGMIQITSRGRCITEK